MSVVNHKYKYLFMHEPYTGGRSIEHALMQQEGSENFNGKHHLSVSEMLEDWITEEEFDTYLKFRVVRNPLDWLVTCWIINDAKRTPFYQWATTKGIGFTTHGTLFWRYFFNVDYQLRFEEDLMLQVNALMLLVGAPMIELEHKGKTKDKPHWRNLLSNQQIDRLMDIYPDVETHGYRMAIEWEKHYARPA